MTVDGRRQIADLERVSGLFVYPRSAVEADGVTYFLARGDAGKRLGIVGDASGLEGEQRGDMTLCPLSAANAVALRERLPRLRPQPLGLRTSAGCGDRLGLATPGHVRAMRHAAGVAPIFAQQSMRENARTGRTPQQVIDDAMWGVFQEGWREPWGADADHLKTTADIDVCVAAGYTFFTVDPGDHVGDWGSLALPARARVGIGDWASLDLPWNVLEDSAERMRDRYQGRTFQIEDFTLTFDETTLARAAAKYGRAIAHTVQMYRHLADQTKDFELEMSVDETETPTSAEEHFFIANELKRLGVQWVSLAPRYVGRFEKGVDYIPPAGAGGNQREFETELAKHAAIARALGPYKLSIHSGSDKFSVYPAFARLTKGCVHLKTAGTSYLEALRAVAQVEPRLFRDILACVVARYPEDRASYHVSAELERVPAPEDLPDADLPDLLDQFDARQVLHVAFGSALARLGSELKRVLITHEETYYATLERHFERHLSPFAG
jgi:hypothetical protein